jgi:hypothetical protein
MDSTGVVGIYTHGCTFPCSVFIVGFEQPVFTVMEATRQYMLGVRVQQQDSGQIAGEAVLSISTMDGSAVGKIKSLLGIVSII